MGRPLPSPVRTSLLTFQRGPQAPGGRWPCGLGPEITPVPSLFLPLPPFSEASPEVLSWLCFSSRAVFSFWVISSRHMASPFTSTLMIPKLTSPLLNFFRSSRLTPISNCLLSISRAGYPRRLKCSLAFVILPQECRWGGNGASRSRQSGKQGRCAGRSSERK